MMKKVILSLLVVFLICPITYALDKDLLLTSGYLNGRAWNALEYNEKIGYVSGFREGISLCLDFIKGYADYEKLREPALFLGLEIQNNYLLLKATNDEIVRYFNSFYSDIANLNIPIYDAYRICCAEYSGVEEALIKEKIGHSREKYNVKGTNE